MLSNKQKQKPPKEKIIVRRQWKQSSPNTEDSNKEQVLHQLAAHTITTDSTRNKNQECCQQTPAMNKSNKSVNFLNQQPEKLFIGSHKEIFNSLKTKFLQDGYLFKVQLTKGCTNSYLGVAQLGRKPDHASKGTE